MAGVIERNSRSWYAEARTNGPKRGLLWSNKPAGPAHAVYFATYEAVKQAMGGNASGHHPLAAGRGPLSRIY